MLMSESKICKNTKKKSRCELKRRRKRLDPNHPWAVCETSSSSSWLGRGQTPLCFSLSSSSHASLCVLDRSTVLPGMLSPDPERSQSSFWWSNPHHFPSQEKEETLLPVSQLLFNYLRWLETHLHPTKGKNGSQSLWPSSSQKEGMTREEVPDPEACPSTLWALPSTAHYQPTATSSIPARSTHVSHSTRMLSPDPSQCHRWPRGKQSQGYLEFSIIPSKNMKLIGNHHRKTKKKKRTWFLYWWPYVMSFTKFGNMILTFFSWICCSPMCLMLICIILRITNLPVYSGLIKPCQTILKKKVFMFIPIFSMFLPKLLKPTCTSECLTVRRYKEMLKLLEICEAIISEPDWKRHHLNCCRSTFVA